MCLGGTPTNSCWGVPLFQTKKASFSTTVFRPGHTQAIPDLVSKKLSSYLRLEFKISDCFKSSLYLFLSQYSSETATTNTFIHSRSSLENPTRFQTKMVKMYIRFQTKTAQKNIYILWGSTYCTTGLCKGVPPSPPWVCATKCTHCFSPDRKSDMPGCHIIICSETGIYFPVSAVKYNC